jgi:hypothetical protein
MRKPHFEISRTAGFVGSVEEEIDVVALDFCNSVLRE